MPRKRSLADLVESGAREKKPRKTIPLIERVRIWGKPWSSHRRKAHFARKERLKELCSSSSNTISEDG